MLRLVCSLPEHNLSGVWRGARYPGYLYNRFTNKFWAGPDRSYALHGSFSAKRLVSLPQIGADQPFGAPVSHTTTLAAPLTLCPSPPSPLIHRLPPFLFPQLPAQDKLRAIYTTFLPQDALSLSVASRCRPLSPLGHRLPAQETCELIASPPAPLVSCLLFVSSLFCYFPILLAATINTKYSHIVFSLFLFSFLVCPRPSSISAQCSWSAVFSAPHRSFFSCRYWRSWNRSPRNAFPFLPFLAHVFKKFSSFTSLSIYTSIPSSPPLA